jgi:hypothetical protein
VVKKKAAKPAVKKGSAIKKKSSAGSASSARVKALQASIKALKKQIEGLKEEVKSHGKHANLLGNLSARRSAAFAKFISGWDRMALAGAARSAKAKKKKK